MGSALPLCRGERLLLYSEKRMSLLYIERGETPSLYKGRSVSLLYTEEVDSSFTNRTECRPMYREGERLLLNTRGGMFLLYIYIYRERGGRLLPYAEESVALFSIYSI